MNQPWRWGGALTQSTTYDWNLSPLGQLVWEVHLFTYTTYPPLKAP